jgi:hypothetical protein
MSEEVNEAPWETMTAKVPIHFEKEPLRKKKKMSQPEIRRTSLANKIKSVANDIEEKLELILDYNQGITVLEVEIESLELWLDGLRAMEDVA